MAEQDMMPLFLFKEKGKDKFKQAGAVITSNGEAYKASSFIEKVTEAIKEEVDSLLQGKETGELTVAAYILLDSLHRVGMVKMADQILDDPTNLYYAAIYTAIGMRAGMTISDDIPEGVQFETTTNDSKFSVREASEEESPGAD